MYVRERERERERDMWGQLWYKLWIQGAGISHSLAGSFLWGPFFFCGLWGEARILEWVAIPFFRKYSRPRDWSRVSRIVGRRFTIWTTREVNLDSILKSRDNDFANKGPSSQSYGFSSSHVWMWELDCEESWAPKNWCFWTVVLENTLESPLDCKEIQPVHSKGDGSWVFIGRTDAEAETPILWPPHGKSWLIGKYSDAGRDCGQEEKGTTEDEMAGWHHRLNGHEFG